MIITSNETSIYGDEEITLSASPICSEILGSSISANPTATIKNFENKKQKNIFFLFPLIGGIILLTGCAVTAFLIYKKKQNVYE